MKEIEGYEDYLVSVEGVVYSRKSGELVPLKSLLMKNGYYKVGLYKAGVIKWFRVQRLVAAAYCERPEGKDVVNHIDCVKTNNHASNLEWVTVAENTQYAWKNGRVHTETQKKATSERMTGSKHPNTHLTEAMVLEIRNLFLCGNITRQKIAKRFGISPTTAGRIISRKCWTHV